MVQVYVTVALLLQVLHAVLEPTEGAQHQTVLDDGLHRLHAYVAQLDCAVLQLARQVLNVHLHLEDLHNAKITY